MKKSNFKLDSTIDLFNLEKLKKKAIKAIEKAPDQIIVDASDVESIKTPGVQFLISFINTAKSKDIAIIFNNPSDMIIRIFEYMGLESKLKTKE